MQKLLHKPSTGNCKCLTWWCFRNILFNPFFITCFIMTYTSTWLLQGCDNLSPGAQDLWHCRSCIRCPSPWSGCRQDDLRVLPAGNFQPAEVQACRPWLRGERPVSTAGSSAHSTLNPGKVLTVWSDLKWMLHVSWLLLLRTWNGKIGGSCLCTL